MRLSGTNNVGFRPRADIRPDGSHGPDTTEHVLETRCSAPVTRHLTSTIRDGMEAGAAVAARSGAGRRPWGVVEVVTFALLSYVPFLLSSPGRVTADTKQYLYLDPGRLLSRAVSLWDPHVAFGTVPHQQVGYLFPMGPYYWLMDAVGVPDWVAQRLWLGSISFAAALGARWLFTMLGTGRIGALAGTLVYLLTPYQLAFTARLSVILLAWAALPWLVGLTMRAVQEGGWRAPALFALVSLVVGSVNASSLVFVLIAPGLWLLMSAFRSADAARATVRAVARIALLSLGVSLWWIIGLRTQGTYGLPVLQLTESVRTVAKWSTPTDIVRGIGNWIFYGRDALGFDLAQAPDYLRDNLVIFATFAIPVLAFAAAGITRWRHRAYFVTLIVVGTVIGVGAWPYDNSSPFGALFKVFANDTSAGLAMRNTPRVVPLVVLGVAALLAAGIGALNPKRRLVAAGAVAVLALVAFLPVWRFGYLSPRLDRPNDIPAYWNEAAAAMQREGNATRVLEIPGANFSTYRWGDTIEPVTPGLIDRPYAAREVLPAGTPAGVNLLDALDHRLQEGTFEPASLAPFARLTNVGTIALRSDLEYERFNTPRPKLLWAQLTDPLAPGLEAPKVFGKAKPNRASPQLPELDNVELRIPPSDTDPPPVSLFDVKDAVPIVHSAPSAQPVLLDGDGEGIVDAAAAGLLDGNQLVLEAAALDAPTLARVVRDDADLVLTDSNRRRSQHYFSRIRDATGYTERADETAPHDGDVFRLEPFPGTGDSSRTVVEQHGAQVGATDYAVAADRPANAFDGDPRSAWRVGGRAIGDRIVVRPDEPVRTDHVTLAQLPGDDQRSISEVRLHFDGGDTLDVHLGDESRTPEGQVVPFPERTVRSLAVEIRDVHVPDLEPLPRVVGFTEIGLGDVRVRETVRLPVHLSRVVGDRADGHRLDVVLSRLRYEPGQLQDEELALDRRFVLPGARAFGLSGTARINPNAADPVLDELLGTTAPGTEFTSADHLAGDLDARASRAFDGDPSTAWTPNFGPQRGRWLDVSLPAPTTIDHIDLTVVADGRHSVPTQFTLAADGVPVRSFTIPDPPDRARPERDARGVGAVRSRHRVGVPALRRRGASQADESREGTPARHRAGLDRRGRAERRTGAGAGQHGGAVGRLPERPAHRERPRRLGAGGRQRGRRQDRPGPRAVRRRARTAAGQQHGAVGARPRHGNRHRPGGALVGRRRRPGGGRGARRAPLRFGRRGARGRLGRHLLRRQGAHRRDAVLARAGRERERRVGSDRELGAGGRAAARQRVRERVARHAEGRGHPHHVAALDTTARRVDRLRRLRDRDPRLHRAPRRDVAPSA